MTADNWPACYAITRKYEGGNDDDPRDPGGRTSRGVIQTEWNKFRATHDGRPTDVWQASEADIAEIYRANYWQAVVGDNWPAGPDLVVWDCAVNSGPARSKSIAAACLDSSITTWVGLAAFCNPMSDKTGFIKDACAKRLSFLHGLRTFSVFGRGWSSRVAGIEASGVKMALLATNMPAPEVQKRLNNEVGTASAASKKHAGGAAAGTAAGGGGGSRVDWSSIDWHSTALEVIPILVLVAVGVAFCVWWAYHHNERAKAYAAAASGA